MSKKSTSVVKGNQKDVAKPNGPPRSLAIAEQGIRTGSDLARLMSAMMSDLISGKLAPGIGNATCNAAGKLLKAVELQYKYGRPAAGSANTPRELMLTEAPNATTSTQ